MTRFRAAAIATIIALYLGYAFQLFGLPGFIAVAATMALGSLLTEALNMESADG